MVETQKKRARIFGEIFKALAFILSIVVITLLMPHEAKYQYQFEMGKPWQYDLLTATFDFPIYKLPEEIKNEREAIQASYDPYFDYLNDTYSHVKQAISQKGAFLVQDHKKGDLEKLGNYLYKVLPGYYEKGIISEKSADLLQKNKAEDMIITRDKIGKSYHVSDIYSINKVVNLILQNRPRNVDEELLLALDLEQILEPNLLFNKVVTDQVKSDEMNNLAISSGMVQTGERIIDRGEIVTLEKFKILESLRKETENRKNSSLDQRITTLMGQALIVTCLMVLFYLYLRLFRPQHFNSKRVIVLILLLIVGNVFLTSLVLQFASVPYVYLIPYALVPIIVSTFLDTRTGLYTHYITLFLCSLLVPHPFQFILLQATAGMVASSSLRDLSLRSQLVRTAAYVVLTYWVVYLGFGLTMDGDVLKMNGWMFALFAVNGILLLLAYPLIYIIEQTFGFISNVRLIELSDINQPLLRKLSEDAPGTFQHTMQVANLATEIANKIGANPMLARTGALYHDIGKSKNPAFFIENQAKGNNPHDQLQSEDSAEIIIRHVTDGLTIAKDYKLPGQIVEFIDTHHGRSLTKYFYNQWCNAHPNEEPDVEAFTYPGPNPYTKEQGIVMICDAVEAASRSLPEYTDESINNLVENIVNNQIANHYLDRTPITFRQINTAKTILKEKLKNIYHTRIAYPELKQTGKRSTRKSSKKRG